MSEEEVWRRSEWLVGYSGRSEWKAGDETTGLDLEETKER